MAQGLIPETMRQLALLQNQLMESNRKIDLVQNKVTMLVRNKRRNQFMLQELDVEPQPTNVYGSVGRMYLISSKEEMKKDIDDNNKDLEKKMKQLEAQHKYLADDNVNIQKNLQEFIKQNS